MAGTLRAMSEAKLLNELGTSLKGEAATATFACGGTIPVAKVKLSRSPPMTGDKRKSRSTSGSNSPTTTRDLSYPEEIEPVDIRWDSAGLKAGTKITFPAQTPFDSESFHQLLSDCEPASFGQGDKGVLDKTHCKAGKLEKGAFMTHFCPYITGIVDVIAQVLLPSIGRSPQLRGIRAERSDLNIYSGPSGKFRAHINTPRSNMQFGLLVVCLPCVYEGGALLVRYRKNTMEFDWSENESESEPAIKWAAFYNDCEHEILEVKSGHRLTITYNLYVTCGVGGKLGIHLSQLYPFLNEFTTKDFPYCLKGVDMAVFEAFRALDLQAELCSVMFCNENECDFGDEESTSELTLVSYGLHAFKAIKEAHEPYRGGLWDFLLDNFPHKVYRDIHWLTHRAYEDMALVWLGNGSDPSLEWKFACTALLVHVPAAADRKVE
ncbi:MAG: hypothetical protein Q9165_006056 [Trypethelium subeluteriae]